MAFKTVDFELSGSCAWLTLNRPEALNTLSVEMMNEIHDVLDLIEKDGETRVLVITGRGRAFCAGADLKGVATGDPADMPFLEHVQTLLLRIRVLPIPVIAAINGIAMGGGLELAMSCDILLAADDAKIADAHSNIGVLPGAGGCAVLPRLIGPAYAKYLVFSGDAVLAPELHRLGLIAKLFPADGLAEGTRQLASRLAEKSPLALRKMKRLIDEGLEQPTVEGALRMELTANAEHASSHDFAEGVRAFTERRKPVFLGR